MENSEKLIALARLGIDGTVNGMTGDLIIVNSAKKKLPTEKQLADAFAEYEAEEATPDPVTAFKTRLTNLENLLLKKNIITLTEKEAFQKEKPVTKG